MSEHPQKPGASGSGQALIWILGSLGVLGVCAVVCCGGGAFLLARQVQSFTGELVSEDPAVVVKRTAEMADITIPPPLKPKAAMQLFLMNMVFYQSDDTHSMVMLASIPRESGETDEELKSRLKRTAGSTPKGGKYKSKSGKELRAEQRTYVIAGQPQSFHFVEQENHDGRISHIYMGTFPGKHRMIMLNINVDPTQVSEDTVKTMIESIR